MYSPQDQNQRKYDSPTSGYEDVDFGEPTTMDKAKDIAGNAGEILKKHWWKAAIAIIVIVAGLLLFDFFIGSIKQVNFSIVDTENKALSGAGIKIFDESGKEIAKIPSNESIKLRRGNYSATVILSGYKSKQGIQVTVSDEPTKTVDVELEKDIDIELSAEDFPAKLVEGQQTEITLSIKNNTSEPQTIELAFEGALDSRYLTATYNSPLLLDPQDNRVNVQIKLKDSIQASLIKNGLTGTIRVKGLNNNKAKQTVTFDLQDFDRTKIKINGSLRFGNIKEGAPAVSKTITIENKFDFPIENVQMEVTIANTQYSNALEVKNWFSFDQTNPIPAIAPGDKVQIAVTARVPVGIPFESSATNDAINGKLKISTSFWKEELDLTLTAQKSDAGIQLSGINSTNTVSFDNRCNCYPVKSGIMKAKNTGNLTLNTIYLSSDCQTTGNWIATGIINFSQTLFQQIAAGKEQQTNYTIDIPNNATRGDIVTCMVNAAYNDPRGGPERITQSIPVNITVN